MSYMVTPLTAKAQEWVNENVQVESWQKFGIGFVVDHHFIDELIEGMIASELLPVQDFGVMHFGG